MLTCKTDEALLTYKYPAIKQRLSRRSRQADSRLLGGNERLGAAWLSKAHSTTRQHIIFPGISASICYNKAILLPSRRRKTTVKSASVFGRRALMRPKATDCSAPSVFIGISRTAPGSHHEPEQMLRGPVNPGEKLLLFRSASLG